MTTLNKAQTKMLKAYLSDTEGNVKGFMKEAPFVSNSEYSAIQSLFADWEVAYGNNELYGTNENNTTFQFEGIDQFPIPPNR